MVIDFINIDRLMTDGKTNIIDISEFNKNAVYSFHENNQHYALVETHVATISVLTNIPKQATFKFGKFFAIFLCRIVIVEKDRTNTA